MNPKVNVIREFLEACAPAKDGRVIVHFDARKPMAHAPHLKGFQRWNFPFAVSLRFAAPTVIDEFGITACLSFGGQFEIVRAPWDSIWAIVAADPMANVEPYQDLEAMPPEVRAPRLQPVEQEPQRGPGDPAAPLPPNVVPFRRPG